MTLQTDFFALAGPLVGNRVYPSGGARATTATYITYFRVTKHEQHTLNANGGAGNLINTRLQADVWSLKADDAQATAAALQAALKGWSVVNIVLDEQDQYEPDTKLHRVMLDISIWHY